MVQWWRKRSVLVSKSSICDDGMGSTWWSSWETGVIVSLIMNLMDWSALVFGTGCVAPDTCSSFVFLNLEPVSLSVWKIFQSVKQFNICCLKIFLISTYQWRVYIPCVGHCPLQIVSCEALSIPCVVLMDFVHFWFYLMQQWSTVQTENKIIPIVVYFWGNRGI